MILMMYFFLLFFYDSKILKYFSLVGMRKRRFPTGVYTNKLRGFHLENIFEIEKNICVFVDTRFLSSKSKVMNLSTEGNPNTKAITSVWFSFVIIICIVFALIHLLFDSF